MNSRELNSDCEAGYVLHPEFVVSGSTAGADVGRSSYGTHLLDHLAAYGTGLAGGQMTVVTVGQINANLL